MLIGLLLIWSVTALGLWLVTALVTGVRARSGSDLLLAALVLGAINAIIRPLLHAKAPQYCYHYEIYTARRIRMGTRFYWRRRWDFRHTDRALFL